MKIYVIIRQHQIQLHLQRLQIIEKNVRYQMNMISHQMMVVVYRKDFVQSNLQQVKTIELNKNKRIN
jgi:hypothetical protein